MTTPTTPPTASCAERIARTLGLLQEHTPITRRVVHAGERIFAAGERLEHLHVVHAGFVKTVNGAADGRDKVMGLHWRGDWLGFDGIADGRHACDAVAMDTGEIWSMRYDALLQACGRSPALLATLHTAMSRELARDRDAMLALCTLPADARVADFLRSWADGLEQRGLRNDQITLHMTRAEIGNYLGMKLETVSRALSRLARDKVIDFAEPGRRDLRIADVGALSAFVERSVAATLH